MSFTRQTMRALIWSRKFSPTAGEACCTSMPCCLEHLGLADAGQLEQLRRCHGARAQDDLAPGTRLDLAPPAARRRCRRSACLRAGRVASAPSVTTSQVGSPHRRLEIAVRHAHAPAAADAGLGLDDAFLVLAVVVRVELEAGGDGGLEQRVVQRVLVGHFRDAQRAGRAAAVGAALLVALDAREQRRHVLPAPAARAHLRPGVVVERLPAHPDEAVDGAGAAQQPCPRGTGIARLAVLGSGSDS